jgi:hypothetical protein
MVEFGVETVYSNAKISQFIQQKRGAIAAFPPVAIAPLFVVNESVRE